MIQHNLNPDNTSLLVIDFQEKLVPIMQESDRTIKNAQTLIKIAKALDMPITVTEQYPKGIGHTVKEITEVLASVEPIEKMSFTACTSDVKEALSKSPRRKILVTGIEAHVCVFQSVRDLLSEEYEVYVVADSVSSRKSFNYENGLALMKDLGAVITNTETVLFDLLKVSDHPRFKELSKLIR